MRNSLILYVASWFYPLIITSRVVTAQANEPWDLNAPCRPYIEEFSKSGSRMIACAIMYSSPPKVCTYCTEEYVALKHLEYNLLKLVNKYVFSRDNTTCSRVIYDSYVISYISELSKTITHKIWESSHCSSCVNINWHFETNSTNYSYSNNTIDFQNKLFVWRHCVSNYSSFVESSYAIICNKCLDSFNELFQFYWDVYTAPHAKFCLDVETTMNDTMNLWHNVWSCGDEGSKDLQDWTVFGYSLTLLIIITVFFYTGSYVQSEETKRRLIHYSELEAPRGLRSYLLSSSVLNAISSKMHIWQYFIMTFD
ncbi:unnamed protein product [Thelazia callipaeda]|uniref:Osteopetrosis-associated transmembrane protein 1 n=1 Tax=Thelazia callipaeda TaxID=103827 RepID=A0A158RB06_THECL|nr:unnamed protein product [Thelazia callipaeda]